MMRTGKLMVYVKLPRELLSKKNSERYAFSLVWEKLFQDQNCAFNTVNKKDNGTFRDLSCLWKPHLKEL